MTDKQCEELAFPVLFPMGRCGYTAECDIMYHQSSTLLHDSYIQVENFLETQSIFSLHNFIFGANISKAYPFQIL